MSYPLKSCVREHSKAESSVRFLLYLLADYTSPRDGYAYPSMATLCRNLSLKVRQVEYLIAAAVKLGELSYVPGRGPGNFSHYIVICGDPKAHSAAPFEDEQRRSPAQLKAQSSADKGAVPRAQTGTKGRGKIEGKVEGGNGFSKNRRPQSAPMALGSVLPGVIPPGSRLVLDEDGRWKPVAP